MTEPDRKTAFVTGGSGFVGSHLIGRLVADGWQVRALARSDGALATGQAGGATPIRGDLLDPTALRLGMRGCTVVFHVAAHFRLWGPQEIFRRINVDGTRAVVDAACATPSVRRVVYVSAAAVVMGDPRPMIHVSERAPLQRRRWAPYSASKAEAETVLLTANGARAEFETIAIRPPFIWGRGMPTLDHMADMVRAGRFQWVAGGDQAMSTCHVDNLCTALLRAVGHGNGGEAYFVSDGEDGTLKSVLTALLETRGVRPKARSAPFGVAWLMAGLMAAAWRSFGVSGEPPLTRQMLRLIGKPFTIDIAKARRDLGYAPIVSFRDGIAAMRPSPSFSPA